MAKRPVTRAAKTATLKGNVVEAIRNRRVLDALTKAGRRLIHVYRLWKLRGGGYLVEAWQESGVSEWDQPAGWKFFHLLDLLQIEQTHTRFPIRSDYSPTPKRRPGRLEKQVDVPKSKRRDVPGQMVFSEIVSGDPAPR